MDKQGNLIPDAHYIFSALPDSSLSAEGESLSMQALSGNWSSLVPDFADLGCMLLMIW